MSAETETTAQLGPLGFALMAGSSGREWFEALEDDSEATLSMLHQIAKRIAP